MFKASSVLRNNHLLSMLSIDNFFELQKSAKFGRAFSCVSDVV